MRLLIVDDEIIAIKGMLAGVEWGKYGVKQVFVAYSTEQAKEIFEEVEIDILICDIEMPGQSGIELLQWVRDNRPNVINSFLTCHANFQYARESIRLEVYDYLLKPALYEDIGNLVKRMVEKREEQIEREQMKKYGENWLADRTQYAEKMSGNKKNAREVVKEVEQFIIGHLSEELSLEKIGIHFYLHPDYLNRVFKKENDISINRYIVQERMILAAKLLSTTTLSANNVALEVGYTNYANFHSMFKRKYGISPGEYKKENQENGK